MIKGGCSVFYFASDLNLSSRILKELSIAKTP